MLENIPGDLYVSFRVDARPRGGGSKSIGRRADGRPVIIPRSSKAEGGWRAQVAHAAMVAMGGRPLLVAEPLVVHVTFFLAWQKKELNRLGFPKPKARVYHLSAPDVTKLWRSTEDALKGIVWDDDSRVVRQDVGKQMSTMDGAEVAVYRLAPPV